MADIQNRISEVTFEYNEFEFDPFNTALSEAIERHAPIKRRYVRANQAPFINKTINKEIIKRSQLRNKFLNTQRNLYASLPRREKKNLCNNISTRDIIDNKIFWKTVKPLFTDEVQAKSKITLIEKKNISGKGQEQILSEEVISEDEAVAVFNKLFINIISNLNTPTNHNYDTDFIVINDS